MLLLYFLASLLALVFVYFSCSRRWLSSLCIRAMLATQMHSNWATQPTLYDPIWLYNVLLYSSTIFLDSNNRFYLLHTLFWGMYHVNLYWWFIIISILQVHISSKTPLLDSQLVTIILDWISNNHFWAKLFVTNTFSEWISGLKLFIKWLQPPMHCDVPKMDFLLIKITWYKEVLAFLSVYVRGHSSFFSFKFSIIDVQHRSGFRPLRRVSPKKYQPSASWCWFGTHVQNCCHWKKSASSIFI